jgi:hypothetical protein
MMSFMFQVALKLTSSIFILTSELGHKRTLAEN